ncbi:MULTISPECIES: putative glycoside hydrolase [unclassified Lentimonas]|uniref:putative glycoside hydrolase n=1 Tax=unclassified Lentimonas TaxID=2630993 RepID=UPI0013292368|nr:MULTISPECIES: putative glycoside hydrolase [unclassified Lentimonas]CAA6692734.1 Unannotated [Lentimonas sp. CC10]CAA6696700.1 Unannotated [Lentimonas sp. CC19]CAA7072320.1 Unannotated [Lentimonas sp. CC11]
MKTTPFLLTASALMLAQSAYGASIQWDNQGIDSNWNTIDNWSKTYLPGTSATDYAVLAANDYVSIESDVLTPANSVNLKMRAGAGMDISANTSSFKNMDVGYLASPGVWIDQSSGAVIAGGYLGIGQLSTSQSMYELSGDSSLDTAGALSVYANGVLSTVGESVTIATSDLELYNLGILQFVSGQSGTSHIDISGTLQVETGSELIIDLSNYWAGGGSIELASYASRTGAFAAADVSIIGLDRGSSATLTYDSDSMDLNIVPKQDAYSKFWFTAAANAGGANAVAEDMIVNTGHGYATLDAPGLSCVRTQDGADLVYAVTWSGSDYDGDGANDTFTFDLRVKAFSGSTYTYDATPGLSSVTLGSASDVTDINGNLGVGDDYDLDAGESLQITVENAAVSASGFVATFDGFKQMDVLETNGGRDHAHIRGVGTNLDSGIFSSATASFATAPVQTFTVTGAGSYYATRTWAITGLAFEFTVSNPSAPYVEDLSDYSNDPTGPGYIDPYPVQTDFTNYPEFSWGSVPRWLAVRSSSAFTEAEINSIANNYQVVMLEKANAQGQASIDAGVINASTRLKAVNSDVTTLFYRNTVVHYGGYASDASYNSDDWSQYTEDADGTRTYSLIRDIYRKYNADIPELREWWIDAALSVFDDPDGLANIDGIFLDKVGGGDVPLIDADGNPASNYVDMLYSLKQQMPAGKLLTGNTLRNENPNGDRAMMEIMEASYFERWRLPNKSSSPEQSVADATAVTIQLMREGLSRGKIMMLQSGPIGFTETDGDDGATYDDQELFEASIDFALSVFLVAAEENAYFSYQDGVNALEDDWKWDSSSIDVLSRPLGAPLTDPTIDGYAYARSYPGVEAWVNLETEEARLLWKTDLGTPAFAGSSTSDVDGNYTIEGGGNISSTADNCFYLSQPHTGDGEIIARVNSVENTHSWAKGAVMFRESTDTGAKCATLYIRPNGSARMSYRATTNGNTQAQTGISQGRSSDPKWIKLVRAGDVFTGYTSLDGDTWALVNQATVTMDSTAEVGLAASSHDNSTIATVEISHVTLP